MSVVVRISCALAAGVAISGCAGVSSAKLSPAADSHEYLVVAKAYSWEHGVLGNTATNTLSAGKYVPIGQDRSGMYYQGTPYCFKVVMSEVNWGAATLNEGNAYYCGIFIPQAAGQDPKVYIYYRTMTASLPREQLDQLEAKAAADAAQAAAASKDRIQEAMRQASVSMPVQMAVTPPPGATALQGGIGGAIGVGLVSAMAAADDSDIALYGKQPPAGGLRSAYTVMKDASALAGELRPPVAVKPE